MKNTRPKPNTAAIKNLKDQGFSVKITHFRKKAYKDKQEPLIPDKHLRHIKTVFGNDAYKLVNQTGGATEIRLSKGEENYVVRADCYVKDRFCKRIGVSEALNRLEKLYNIKA